MTVRVFEPRDLGFVRCRPDSEVILCEAANREKHDTAPPEFVHRRADDLRIERVRPLLSPAVLAEDLPLPEASAELTHQTRRAIEGVLFGSDQRLLAIVGPCSIHAPAAGLEYARRLATARRDFAETLLVVMRVYFEKPRTVVGWKGLINDPDLDGSYQPEDDFVELMVCPDESWKPACVDMTDPTFRWTLLTAELAHAATIPRVEVPVRRWVSDVSGDAVASVDHHHAAHGA